MINRIVVAVLNGVVTLVVLLVAAAILRIIPGLGQIAGIVDQFAFIIAVLVGFATFFGAIPNMWGRWIA